MNIIGKINRNKTRNKPFLRAVMIRCLFLAFIWPMTDVHSAPDRFEVNDTPEIANVIFLEDSDFIDPLPPEDFRNFHSEDDIDWVIFFTPQDSEGNNSFTIRVEAVGDNVTDTLPKLTVFDPTGRKACAVDIAEVAPEDKCLIEGERFTPFIEGFYFAKLENSSTILFDDDTAYSIRIGGIFSDRIFGFVRDATTGESLPGAIIAILGTTLSAQSIEAPKTGFYRITLPAANFITIAASREGYIDFLRVNLEIKSGTEEFNIDMIPETPSELVVGFVRRFYKLILGRDPDQAGLDGWVDDLLDGAKTGSDIAEGFIFSDEFKNRMTLNPEYLTVLYLAFFDREPDTGGYNNWLDQLRSGAERKDILNGFLKSQEFSNLAQEFGIKPLPDPVEGFVRRFYQLIFG